MDLDCRDGVCAVPADKLASAPLPAGSPPPGPPVRAVTAATFGAVVLDAPGPVLVDFAAEWCGPCKALALFLPKLVAEFHGRLQIVRIDGDADPALAKAHGVESYPALLGFHHGAEVARRLGFDLHDYPALWAWVAGLVAEATGEPVPPSAGEAAFAAAAVAAARAHDDVVLPLLYAAIAAQEPHLPAHQAAMAALRAERDAGRIDDAGLERGTKEAARRLHEAIGPAHAALEAAGNPAGEELRRSIERATAAFLVAAASGAIAAGSVGEQRPAPRSVEQADTWPSRARPDAAAAQGRPMHAG